MNEANAISLKGPNGPNDLNALHNVEGLEHVGRATHTTISPGYSSSPASRSIEQMSEEEQVELALQKSMMEAVPPHSPYRYENPAAFNRPYVAYSTETTYTTNPTAMKSNPLMTGAVGAQRSELEGSSTVFQFGNTSGLPRKEIGLINGAGGASAQRRGRDTAELTEAEMLEQAMAESRIFF